MKKKRESLMDGVDRSAKADVFELGNGDFDFDPSSFVLHDTEGVLPVKKAQGGKYHHVALSEEQWLCISRILACITLTNGKKKIKVAEFLSEVIMEGFRVKYPKAFEMYQNLFSGSDS